MRKMMLPHTATKLRESKRNMLKDFVHVAGPLGVTHFLILTATENACYLRVAKPPRVSPRPCHRTRLLGLWLLLLVLGLAASEAPI